MLEADNVRVGECVVCVVIVLCCAVLCYAGSGSDPAGKALFVMSNKGI